MTYVTIEELEDFYQLLGTKILLTGLQVDHEQELLYNTCKIRLTKNVLDYLTMTDLKDFIFLVLKNRSEQVENLEIDSAATFYLWFDETNLELCFNILSGTSIDFPFYATVHKVSSYEFILKRFLDETEKAAESGEFVEVNNMNIIEPVSGPWHDKDDRTGKVQEVYVQVIPSDALY